MKPYWIVLGPENSWETAFEQGAIWGVRQALYPEWKALDPDDTVFFYVTKTVKGVIGVGRVGSKFIQDKPLWPDEIAAGRLVYPYRFELHVDYLLGREHWPARGIPIGLSIQEMRRGINLLRPETVQELRTLFRERLGYDLVQDRPAVDSRAVLAGALAVGEPPSHAELQDLLFHIGRLNRFVAEKEYPMEGERLDVVWRRIDRSVPTYVFEIQVGGDVYHAIGKLKHAFDLWNSRIFFVAETADMQKAAALLSGTFHEIQHLVKNIPLSKVRELHEQKSRWIEIEKELGLL